MCYREQTAQREPLPVRIFHPSPSSSLLKAKASSECWISWLYLAVRLWISVLTVSENELFRFCLSLPSLRLLAFLPSRSLPFLSAAYFSPLFSLPLISKYIVFMSLSLSLSLLHFCLDSLCLHPFLISGLFLPPHLLFPLLLCLVTIPLSWPLSFSAICSALFCNLTGYRLPLRR